MDQKEKKQENEIEIDLGKVLRAILGRAWLIMLVAVLCASAMFTATKYMVTPLYKSSAKFYVNNSALSVGNTSLSISSSDLVTSRGLVDSYIVILNTKETLEEVISSVGSDLTYKQLSGMISAGAVNETEIFAVTVTSADPEEAEKLANAIADVLPKRIGLIIEGSSAKVVEKAMVATRPSSPSYSKNVMLGFLAGFALSAGLIALRVIFDTAVRSDEDIAEVCTHPILVSVPDLLNSSMGGYEYTYDRDAEKKAQTKPRSLFGQNISFAASESYKLLRTKLQFSFADDKTCRVIGVSSSLSGEGKSVTSINLAYSLSQLNKKVILIDCDMRRPTLAEKLGVQKKPGLSSYLTGQSKLVDLVQTCGFTEDEKAFHVITAGQNPPNPVERLISARMEKMVEILKRAYDYVIFDLPPAGEVSDAMAVAKQTDGILLVVRQNNCDRFALSETVRQFEFIEARILGVVFNCVNDHGGKGYYKKYYKGRYYGKYGYFRRYYYSRYYKGRAKAQSVVNEALDKLIEE